MKKLTIYILFTLMFSKIIFSQNDLQTIQKDWLAIRSDYYKRSKMISPIEGAIFSFSKDKLSCNYVFNDSISIYSYELKRKKLKINDKKKYIIHFLSEDSLKLVFDKNMVVTFIPLTKSKERTELTIERLINNSWTYKIDEYQQRIDFLIDEWGMFENDNSKICITHTKGNRYCWQENELWNFNSTNEYDLLTITQMQFSAYTHQVLKQRGDTIFTQFWYENELLYPILIKNKKMDSISKTMLIQSLISKRWETTQIIDYSSSFDEDTSNNEYESSGSYLIDTILISKEMFLNKKMAFVFTIDNYQIFVDNKVYTSGKWKLSPDGRYIILDNGFNPNNYIELIEIQNDKLIIGKSDQFSTGKRRRFIEYFYRLSLE